MFNILLTSLGVEVSWPWIVKCRIRTLCRNCSVPTQNEKYLTDPHGKSDVFSRCDSSRASVTLSLMPPHCCYSEYFCLSSSVGYDLANLILKLPSDSSLHNSCLCMCPCVCWEEGTDLWRIILPRVFYFYPRFWFTNTFWFNSHLSPRAQFNFYSKYHLCCAFFSEVFAAVPLFVSLSEMFVSCVTAQFELLLEHSAGSADRRCPPPAPGFITHWVYLISPALMWSEGFSKLLPSSWGDSTLGTYMLDWWWERERMLLNTVCYLSRKKNTKKL